MAGVDATARLAIETDSASGLSRELNKGTKPDLVPEQMALSTHEQIFSNSGQFPPGRFLGSSKSHAPTKAVVKHLRCFSSTHGWDSAP